MVSTLSRRLGLILALILPLTSAAATNTVVEASQKSRLPCDPQTARSLTARRTAVAPIIDGQLEKEVWSKAAVSERFVDLISGERTHRDTRVQLLWDDTHLYAAYTIDDSQVRPQVTQHNDPIHNANDVVRFLAAHTAYNSKQ